MLLYYKIIFYKIFRLYIYIYIFMIFLNFLRLDFFDFPLSRYEKQP